MALQTPGCFTCIFNMWLNCTIFLPRTHYGFSTSCLCMHFWIISTIPFNMCGRNVPFLLKERGDTHRSEAQLFEWKLPPPHLFLNRLWELITLSVPYYFDFWMDQLLVLLLMMDWTIFKLWLPFNITDLTSTLYPLVWISKNLFHQDLFIAEGLCGLLVCKWNPFLRCAVPDAIP